MTANSVSSVVPAVQCTGLGVPLSRVVTRYMGPGINSKKTWGGIRDHSTGIWDQKPLDRNQHYCKGIRDPVLQHDNKDHKILKCALIGGACQHFSIKLYFLLKHFNLVLNCTNAIRSAGLSCLQNVWIPS